MQRDREVSEADAWVQEMWPPSSSKLNPLDFSAWEHSRARANAIPHANINSLKRAAEEWTTLPEEYVANCGAAFRRGVQAVFVTSVGVFEK